MNEVSATGNATVVIDDKDTINKTVNKTVNVTKSDNTQLESDVKVIQSDITKLIAQFKRQTVKLTNIENKIDALMTKLDVLPVAETQKEVEE